MGRTEELGRFVRDHHLSRLQADLGASGVDLAKKLYPQLRKVYRCLDYESISGSLTVFLDTGISDMTESVNDPVELDDLQELTSLNAGTLTIQILSSGSYRLWYESIHPEKLGESTLAYIYSKSGGERFWVGGKVAGEPVPVGYPLFALPVFKSLDEALRRYATHVARFSQCAILEGLWREPGRVVWQPAPEKHMRRSLYFYLRNTLSDGTPDVQEEAPVDDRNPVDLTVRWAESNRIAVIEVKWLGASGRLAPPHITRRWRDDRAQKGLRQLASYLDRTRERAPNFDRRGYLVIFDGRRAKVSSGTVELTRDRGLFYARKEIEFDSTLLRRHDMARPVRCFCEPLFDVASPSSGLITA